METKQEKLPVMILLFIYITPALNLFLIFMGLRYQIVHPMYIWLSLLTIIAILAVLPFLKKKRKWTRHLFMGLCLFFTILLFSPSIEFPLLTVLPVLWGLKIFLILLFLYFGYFFTIFLANIEILDYFFLLEDQVSKNREFKINKVKKWRKMFYISAATIFTIFTATGIFMVSRCKLITNKLNEKNKIEYFNKILKKFGKLEKEKNPNIKKFDDKKISFNYHSYLKIVSKRKKITISKKINKQYRIISTLEKRPYFSDIKILLDQIVLMRYVNFARMGMSLIEANTFKVKDKKSYGVFIQVQKHKELIYVNKVKRGVYITFFVLTKNTLHETKTLINSLKVKL